MKLTDEEFREEYHPLHVPGHFDAADTERDQLIFALAELGEASADEITAEWERLQASPVDEQQKAFVKTVLKSLFDKGLLNGSDKNGTVHYNLHKVTQANDGETDPELLAPGLD